MKYYDLDAERNLLCLLVQNKNFCSRSLIYNRIVREHFVDQFNIDVFGAIKLHYNKFGIAPSYKRMLIVIGKTITYDDDKYKNRIKQLEIWQESIKRFYKELPDGLNAKSEMDTLEELRKLRVAQDVAVKIVGYVESENTKALYKTLSKAANSFNRIDNVITKGNIVDDLRQHLQMDQQMKSGDIKFIKSNIIGIRDLGNGKVKLFRLDDYFYGGWYYGEVVFIVGEQSVGKSFLLMEAAWSAARYEKKNSLLVTIEMNKEKSQRRIYSRATGIPYWKFKTGQLDKDDIKKLKYWRDDWRDKGYGILEVASFDKGATVMDIENTLIETENKYNQEFALTSIDYLQDLKPIGKHGNDKDWTAMGEISWDMACLSKYYDNHRGMAMMTASQRKTKDYGKGATRAGSAFGSALPEHHATIGIGIGQDDNDRLMGRIRWDVFKNRDGDRGISFYTFPDFAKSKISSIKKIKEFYGDNENGE